MSDNDSGSDGEQQPKGNMFLAQNAMKSKMNMDDQKKLTCLGCNKDIWPNQEKQVPQTGKHFHAECFKCETCKGRLPSGKFSALKGHFYCIPHYTELLKAAGGKVDAVAGSDRSTVEKARQNAAATAAGRVGAIKAAEDEGRGANWQAAKSSAQGTVNTYKSVTSAQASEAKLASDRASKATSSTGQGLRAKFAPPKPSFERTSVGDAPAPAKPAPPPAKAAAFKAPTPAASSAPKGGVGAAAAKFSAPSAPAAKAPPAKPAAKAAAPPARAASPGGGAAARSASPGAGARGGFKPPTPKFEVDEEEERRKKEEEERKRREDEERQREEEERRQREEEERRAEEDRQRQEEEERQRQEEEERQRQEAEAAQEAPQEEAPQEEAPQDEAPPADDGNQDQGGDFQPTAGRRWERIEHEDGDVYFYNHETGESLWEQPEDYDG